MQTYSIDYVTVLGKFGEMEKISKSSFYKKLNGKIGGGRPGLFYILDIIYPNIYLVLSSSLPKNLNQSSYLFPYPILI